VSEAATFEALLTAADVAPLLGWSTATVLDKWEAGELPGFRLPSGAVRFRASELERWVQQYRVPVETELT
jgi:excisionase family DNA binding protein